MNCRCGNAARYITIRGEFTCAICPIKDRVDAIRLSDIPRLIRVIRRGLQWLEFPMIMRRPSLRLVTLGEELRALLGRCTGSSPFLIGDLVSFNSECWEVVDHSDAHEPQYSYWLVHRTTSNKYPVPVTQEWLHPWTAKAPGRAERHACAPASSSPASTDG